MRGTENALYLSHVWLANFALQERKVKVVSITNSRVRRFGSARVLFVHVAKINGFKMLLNAKLQHIPKGKELIALLLYCFARNKYFWKLLLYTGCTREIFNGAKDLCFTAINL